MIEVSVEQLREYAQGWQTCACELDSCLVTTESLQDGLAQMSGEVAKGEWWSTWGWPVTLCSAMVGIGLGVAVGISAKR